MSRRLTTNGLHGDEAPLSLTARTPDKREVSMRWLIGSFLTGVTSLTLMGAALFVAVDGKQFLATPPEVASETAQQLLASPDNNTKAGRLLTPTIAAPTTPTDRRRMSVSTMTRVGDMDVVRTQPFEHIKIALGANNRTSQSYPGFDPLKIFAEGNVEQVDPALAGGTLIYGANVETEAAIRVVDFSFEADLADDRYIISDVEAEQIVRNTAAIVTDGTTEVASLYYVDPIRFGVEDPALAALDVPSAARIIPMNISVAPADAGHGSQMSFIETVIDIPAVRNITDTLVATGNSGAEGMARALSTLLNTDSFKEGHVIRIGVQKDDLETKIVRSSVYDGKEHVLTIALNDQQQFVPTPEPLDNNIMAQRANKETSPPAIPLLAERDLPDAYNAIYRGVLAYDLDQPTAAKVIRMVAADVDFRSRIGREDRLELFYSIPEESEDSQKRDVLYVEAYFGGQTRKYYRFISPDGTADYYDSEGRSARQFLLRNPVPSGKFRSGFGMRRHPILKYSKMHWGVDWSAPRGTPIISPGNGVVQKAGWAGGYGKQTVVKHANGYETSYSHQTRFGKGIRPGVRVRQGQVIGYIGTTGLSTGPHLHYEMRVNGKRVDPMRVRLPKGNTLSGEQLAAFESERDRIDTLLADGGANAEMAALN